jgi:hypothetical protein
MSDFYMTLPSNASVSSFRDNSPSEYKINLSEPIDLRGEWEVGLVEVNYPKSWNCIPRNEFIKVDGKRIKIDEGQYSSFEELFLYLNEQIKESTSKKVRFYHVSGKIALDNSGECEIYISKDFGEMMGFDKEEATAYTFVEKMFRINSSVKSKYPADIQHGIHNLFFYCDIIEPQVVGDYRVPLLRIVPVGKGRVVTKYFQNVYYYPVMTKKCSVIEINIKDTLDSPIEFQHGSTYVVLHFRERKK